MDTLLYLGVAMAVVAMFFSFIGRGKGTSEPKVEKSAPKYNYRRKQFIMTRAENEFYRVLQNALGTSYMVYPQVHLSTFLDHSIKGQNWRAALSVIQRKSVDFLICNREFYNPLVAIELDDSSHNTAARKKRDEIVEGICERAEMPLVRIRWQPGYDSNSVLRELAPYLK